MRCETASRQRASLWKRPSKEALNYKNSNGMDPIGTLDPEVEARILLPFKRKDVLFRRLRDTLYGPWGWALTFLGIAALTALPLPELQKRTYVDENGLLPGQVCGFVTT